MTRPVPAESQHNYCSLDEATFKTFHQMPVGHSHKVADSKMEVCGASTNWFQDVSAGTYVLCGNANTASGSRPAVAFVGSRVQR